MLWVPETVLGHLLTLRGYDKRGWKKQVRTVQEDVNGEKPTVKKWWIFGADFVDFWCRFFHGL